MRSLPFIRSHRGELKAVKISVLGYDLYLLQAHDIVDRIMRHPGLASLRLEVLYVYALRTVFDVPSKVQTPAGWTNQTLSPSHSLAVTWHRNVASWMRCARASTDRVADML